MIQLKLKKGILYVECFNLCQIFDVFILNHRHSTGDRPARPLSGSLFGRSRSNKPRLPPISDKLDLATEGSHHRILLEEDNYLVKSGSSQEMEEEEPLSYEKSEEVANKPISEESTPDEDEDFFARSSKDNRESHNSIP